MSDYQQNKQNADIFTQEIKDLVSKPENLENLNSYRDFINADERSKTK